MKTRLTSSVADGREGADALDARVRVFADATRKTLTAAIIAKIYKDLIKRIKKGLFSFCVGFLFFLCRSFHAKPPHRL